MNVEQRVSSFIQEAIESADVSTAIHGAELHETVYEAIRNSFGIRIGDCESELAPTPGGGEMEEFDALLTIVCYARVAGQDKTERTAARDQAIDIAKAVAGLFLADPSMGGRVRDSRVLRAARGFESVGSQPYAVCNLQLIVNATGQLAIK